MFVLELPRTDSSLYYCLFVENKNNYLLLQTNLKHLTNLQRTMARDGQKWLILMKLILKSTSYEGSFITKIKKFISLY